MVFDILVNGYYDLWFPFLLSGVLTGKYKRGVRPDPNSGRIGYTNHHEIKGVWSSPYWGIYEENEAYWTLMDLMEKIAGNHGNISIKYLYVQL